jgi:sulfatase maturation enzyme AslB (radical SAM superfamily)
VLETGLTGGGLSERLGAVRGENRLAVDRMRECRWFSVCHGGCPHDRYTGERRLPGHDGRCCGLAPLLDDMAVTLRRERGSGLAGDKGHVRIEPPRKGGRVHAG